MLHTKVKPPKQSRQLVALHNAASPTALSVPSANTLTVDYLSMVFETFLDTVFPYQGFMLIDAQGRLVQSSPYAQELSQSMVHQAQSASEQESLPDALEPVVSCLIESRQLFPGEPIQLQDEVTLNDDMQVCIEAEWVDLDAQETACIVATLKNQTAIAQQQAAIAARRYGFTERETEVWQYSLLGCSYSEIGQKLFISINTVKQHMKRIYQKQNR